MTPPRVTREGLRSNVDVCLSYLAPWLCGVGCVLLHHLMEDAATAEISRCQLWQWSTHAARMDDGEPVTRPLLLQTLQEVKDAKRREMGEERWAAGRWGEAADVIQRLIAAEALRDFLTLEAYPLLDHSAAPSSSSAAAAQASAMASKL